MLLSPWTPLPPALPSASCRAQREVPCLLGGVVGLGDLAGGDVLVRAALTASRPELLQHSTRTAGTQRRQLWPAAGRSGGLGERSSSCRGPAFLCADSACRAQEGRCMGKRSSWLLPAPGTRPWPMHAPVQAAGTPLHLLVSGCGHLLQEVRNTLLGRAVKPGRQWRKARGVGLGGGARSPSALPPLACGRSIQAWPGHLAAVLEAGREGGKPYGG